MSDDRLATLFSTHEEQRNWNEIGNWKLEIGNQNMRTVRVTPPVRLTDGMN